MRRIISAIAMVALIVTMMPQIIFAASAPSDGIRETNVLFELSVTDFQLPTEIPVTRAAFTRYAMKLADIPVTPHEGTVFEDVASSNPDYDYIMSAVDFGLISYGTNYRPNDSITLSEASKIMVKLLGYDYVAESKGGYPNGYLQTALDIDLLSGMSLKERTLSQTDAGIILYNSLHIELPQITYTDEGKYEYRVGSDTILGKFRNITLVNGTVDGTPAYATSDENGLGDGKLSINGVVYNSGNINTSNLFGCKVEAYINNESKTVVSCQVSDSTRIINIYAEDIISYNNRRFTYADVTGKEKTVSIGLGTCVFYNGKIFDYDSSKLVPESGSLTFVSAGSGEVTALYINSYKTVVVDRIMKTDYIIIDKYSSDNNLTLNPDKTEYTITTQDGEPIEFDSLEQGDVLNVAMSDDDTYAEVICVRDRFMGTYSGYSNNYIHIDGTEYRLTSGIKDRISSLLTLGGEAIFSLDINNCVADVSPVGAAGENVGYLFWGRYMEKGMDISMYARILDLDGKTYLYKFADTFNINGVGYKDVKKAWADYKSPDYNSLICSMVLYSLDSKGNLKSLTYSDKEGGNGGLYVTHTVEEADRYHTFQRYYNNVGNDIICDTNLVVFKVPGPSWSVDNIDEEEYTVESPMYLETNDVAVGYKLVGYTTTENEVLSKYLLMQKISDDGAEDVVGFIGRPYMINSITKVIVDEEPREKMTLCGHSFGPDNPKVVYSKEETSFSDAGLAGGDIIQVNTTENDVVKSFKIVYKKGAELLADGTDRMAGTARVPELDISLCYVYNFRGSGVHVVRKSLFSDNIAQSDIKPLYYPTAKLLRYDDKLKSVVSVSANEIKDYENFKDDKALVITDRTYYAFVGMFIVG